MRQYNPPHPGEVLYGLDMEPAGLTVTEVAGRLGVDRKTVSRIVNGHMGISADMAVRLSRAFNTTPELWLNMQNSYDLWYARQKLRKEVDKIRPFPHREQSCTLS